VTFDALGNSRLTSALTAIRERTTAIKTLITDYNKVVDRLMHLRRPAWLPANASHKRWEPTDALDLDPMDDHWDDHPEYCLSGGMEWCWTSSIGRRSQDAGGICAPHSKDRMLEERKRFGIERSRVLVWFRERTITLLRVYPLLSCAFITLTTVSQS
jgi:hypothetical protein